jgi:hypothetical protein
MAPVKSHHPHQLALRRHPPPSKQAQRTLSYPRTLQTNPALLNLPLSTPKSSPEIPVPRRRPPPPKVARRQGPLYPRTARPNPHPGTPRASHELFECSRSDTGVSQVALSRKISILNRVASFFPPKLRHRATRVYEPLWGFPTRQTN